jgi:hypothetical protein
MNACGCANKETRLSAGFVFSACDGSPSLQGFVIPCFPTRHVRQDRYPLRLDFKAEVCAILEHDADGASVVSDAHFNVMHGLALDFREAGSFAGNAGECNLALSHCRLSSGALVRGGAALQRFPVPL